MNLFEELARKFNLEELNEPCTEEEYNALKCKNANSRKGDLNEVDGYDCALCANRGYFLVLESGEIKLQECKCIGIRNTLKRAKKSGLGDLLKDYKFSKYEVIEDWQKNLKEKVQAFIADDNAKWLWIGGQPGIGKTMLCTAACAHYIKQGCDTLYMPWYRDSKRLKALVNEPQEYEASINRIKSSQVLYIDDFFKTIRGGTPTEADVKLAFEIINDRLIDSDKITMITCERTIQELIAIDEGTISRICEKCKGYCLNIAADRKKNYRTRGLFE